MDKNDGGFSTEYVEEKSTDTSSETTQVVEEEKVEEETQYNIAKPTRRYLRGSISKNED